MKRILAAFGVAGLALLGATAPATASPSDDEKKITICHATGSESNPYVSVTINLNGLNGHVGHQHDGDIIPANDGKVLPGGQNLDKVDIWNAGCAVEDKHGDGNGNGNGNWDHKITICHATGSESNPYVEITVDVHAVKAHAEHGGDIIPGNSNWPGQNWDEEGQATYDNGCVPCPPSDVTPEEPPVVPPVVTPVVPPVVTPVVPPVVTPETPVTPVVPVETPRGAVVGTPTGQGAVVANNPGFNVQTAVAGSTDVAVAPWAAGIVVLLLAAAGVAARKTLAASGTVSGPRKE
ncbi:hypothetical protein GU243_06670 [Pseudarthrobacter psychrotolerans]|uniref:Uncharacterized protein n=1 Tax=Pseudarthrobacter psychrotolerans TaxID=2697569 RepID=A0A6P1NJG3_9MICC|nr:hypothetical protein [Pseudarthrobacter psychrotolerans]QHK19478.1 hypothetical protein GU243_06670 [Pseudarthrobacter psychrotolerans]